MSLANYVVVCKVAAVLQSLTVYLASYADEDHRVIRSPSWSHHRSITDS